MDVMRCAAACQVIERVAEHLEHDQCEKADHTDSGHRFVLPVTVGMIVVRRAPGREDSDESDDIGSRVGERVKPVGQNADGAAGIPKRNLGQGDDQIQQEDARQNTRDTGVPLRRHEQPGPATIEAALSR